MSRLQTNKQGLNCFTPQEGALHEGLGNKQQVTETGRRQGKKHRSKQTQHKDRQEGRAGQQAYLELRLLRHTLKITIKFSLFMWALRRREGRGPDF